MWEPEGPQEGARAGAYLALLPAQAVDAGSQLHSAEGLCVMGW